MLGGGRHDLVPVVIGRAAREAGEAVFSFMGCGWQDGQRVTIWYYSHHLILAKTVMLPKPIVAAVLAALSTGCAVGPIPRCGRTSPCSASGASAPWSSGSGGQAALRDVVDGFRRSAVDPVRHARARAGTSISRRPPHHPSRKRAGLSAANAALLPSGNVSGQAARVYQSVETPLGRVLNSTPGFDRHGNDYEADFTASWELDVFGGLRRGREAALADYQASEAAAVATRLAVAAQTADIYITIRGLQGRLKVARHQVQTEQDLLSTINLLYGRGAAGFRSGRPKVRSLRSAQRCRYSKRRWTRR